METFKGLTKGLKHNLSWILGAFCIALFLVLFEPFGTTFRNSSAIVLALSYGALSVLSAFILNKTLKNYFFANVYSSKSTVQIIWYSILLLTIALVNFLYFGLWSCHCDTQYNLTLFASKFVPRTFAIGSFIIMTDRILKNLPKTTISDKTTTVKNGSVVAVSSFGNYLRIKRIEKGHLNEFIERGTLKEFGKRNSLHFFRCHRSHTVNIHYVKKIIKKNRRYLAILEYDLQIPLSASKVHELKSIIER